MTTTSVLTAKFVEALDVKTEQPKDAYINDIFESLGQLLYVVKYDEVNKTHNLIRIMQDDATYSAKYGPSFLRPTRLKVFDATIDTTSAFMIKTCNTVQHTKQQHKFSCQVFPEEIHLRLYTSQHLQGREKQECQSEKNSGSILLFFCTCPRTSKLGVSVRAGTCTRGI